MDLDNIAVVIISKNDKLSFFEDLDNRHASVDVKKANEIIFLAIILRAVIHRGSILIMGHFKTWASTWEFQRVPCPILWVDKNSMFMVFFYPSGPHSRKNLPSLGQKPADVHNYKPCRGC